MDLDLTLKLGIFISIVFNLRPGSLLNVKASKFMCNVWKKKQKSKCFLGSSIFLFPGGIDTHCSWISRLFSFLPRRTKRLVEALWPAHSPWDGSLCKLFKPRFSESIFSVDRCLVSNRKTELVPCCGNLLNQVLFCLHGAESFSRS
jgi:hypothetical protein